MESRTYAALADRRLDGLYDDEQMRRLVIAASLCVAESPVQRPSITEVEFTFLPRVKSQFQNFSSASGDHIFIWFFR